MKPLFHILRIAFLCGTLLGIEPDEGWIPSVSVVQAQLGFPELFNEKKDGQKAKDQPPLAQSIQEKKDKALSELKEIQKDLDMLAVSASPAQARNLKDQKTLLEELNLYYEQILEAESRSEHLAKEAEDLKENLDTWSQPETPVILDANFEILDGFSDHYQLTSNRLKTASRSVATLQTNLEEAKEESIRSDKERRRIKEEFETTGDPTLKSQLQYELPLLEIKSRIAQAKITLLGLELKNEKGLQENLQLESQVLSKKIGWLKEHVKFTQEELDREIERIEIEKENLIKALQTARKDFQDFEAEWAGQQEKISPEQTEILQSIRKTMQDQIAVLAQRFQRLGEWEKAWHRRHQSFNQIVKKTTLADWQEETLLFIDQVRRQETLVNVRISEIRKDLQTTEQKIGLLGEGPSAYRTLLVSLQNQYQRLLAENENFLSGLSRESQLYQKLLDEISPQVDRLDVGEKFALVWNKILKVWNFEITSIDDKPITVKKLVLALILLLLGFALSRRVSQLIERKIFPRFGLASGVAAAFQTLIFYGLATIITIIVLYIVNVPLTLFTVLGGALAIGVGFGSQNIVRNFISGLILLMEQPIKIGDMVEVDEIIGIIERIGARSTRIRKFNNIHVIVPNSDFLEKKVINWTLSDDLVRIQVNIGVDYESPIREVTKLIRMAVEEHGKVLKDPEPIVIFNDFADNYLKFEVHFWIRMRTQMDRLMVESDIRYRIDGLFREAGIIFPYPQRDVHLDTAKPLEVRVLEKEDLKEGNK